MKLFTMFLIVAVAAMLASAAQASSKPVSPHIRALMIRGDALNKKYGLGKYGSASFVSAQNRAIHLRSLALNRQYGLGTFKTN